MVAFRHAESQRRKVWPPDSGTFAMALVRKGWHVPCRIVEDEQGWHAIVDGVAQPAHADPAFAPMIERIWTGGVKIPEPDFLWLESVRAWALAHAPDHPAANPGKPIDPRRLIPIMPAQQRTPA